MVGIILAAGLGSRCKEITQKKHKALIEINGKPNIENNIEFLFNQGVDKVIVITGYLREQFEYLKEKYKNVELLFNPKFREYNNIYSMYLALPYIDDGFITMEADIVVHKNIKYPLKNKKAIFTVMQREEKSLEWFPKVDKNGFVYKIDELEDITKPSFIGITYYSPEDAKIIKKEYEKYVVENEMIDSASNYYWDKVGINVIDKLNVEVVEFPQKTFTEIDNYNNYLSAIKNAESNIN